MKTLAWLFGIFFCVSSAYGQKTVTIEGDIRNMPDTVRFSCAACTSYIYYITPESSVLKVGQGYKFLSEEIRTYIKDK